MSCAREGGKARGLEGYFVLLAAMVVWFGGVDLDVGGSCKSKRKRKRKKIYVKVDLSEVKIK